MIIRALYISILFTLGSGAVMSQSKEKSTQKPNFIIILADDLGFADLSMNGSKQINTPNIDALAKTGTNFNQSYVSSAVCSPSRAGLITGKNQVEFGYDNNLSEHTPGFDPEYAGLPVTEKTIASRLKEFGYATGLIGKWHLGYKEQFHPLRRGFDEFWGYTGGGHDYFTSEVENKGRKEPIECNYKTPQKITYITDDKGDECSDFILRHKDEPFFLYASFNAPHAPMQATNDDLELYKHIKDEGRRTYAAMVHRLDVNVGKIVKVLENEGLLENTLVIFLSDNGGPADQNFSCNAPYRGQKGILLEGGIHVPYIMSWPGRIPSNKTFEKPISALDIAPTFFELAGGSVDSEEFTGVNLMPFILGKRTDAPHENLKWKFTISRSIREGDWKLISIPDRLPMLYHLPSDISEQKDLSVENLDKTRDLLKKLGEWDVSLPHNLILEGAEWKKKQLELYDNEYVLKQPGSKE